MYLIDQPYVSNFLRETIIENNYRVVETKEAKAVLKDEPINWISEKDAIVFLKRQPNQPIYSNSENALSWINKHLGDSILSQQINIFKDKVAFREHLKAAFPNFTFKKVRLEEIQQIEAADLTFPFVIKPSIGFLSHGVFIIENEKDWKTAKNKINQNNLKSIFPKSVLDTSYFIIEDFIIGEEYAIDYYYNDKGEVVVLNILHHLFSSGTDTSDRVYVTSEEIIYRHKDEIERFLTKIGDQLNLRNFPAHAEIRIDHKNNIVPIEINPLRFGGWCTSADLSGIALGLNSYTYFIENKRPDWNKIFQDKEEKLFGLIVLDNQLGILPENIDRFDYEALASDFEKPLLVRKLDIKRYPLFGFVFTETNKNNQRELYDILKSDLRKYIYLK